MNPLRGRAAVVAMRCAPVVAILLLCVLFAIALGSGPRGTGVSLPTTDPTQPPAPEGEEIVPVPEASTTSAGEPASEPPPAAFGYVLGGLLILAVFTIVWWVVRLLLRVRLRRGGVRVRRTALDEQPESDTFTDEEVEQQVASAVAEGLRDIDDGDPRRAVIDCWVRLERTAESAGTLRRPGDTPADLVARLLAEHRISADALQRLAGLYRRARYAPDEVAVQMRDEARTTLERLASELSGVDS